MPGREHIGVEEWRDLEIIRMQNRERNHERQRAYREWYLGRGAMQAEVDIETIRAQIRERQRACRERYPGRGARRAAPAEGRVQLDGGAENARLRALLENAPALEQQEEDVTDADSELTGDSRCNGVQRR